MSVGEVLTARALLPELRERYPRLRIFLSTTTMTGQQIAAQQPAVRRRGVLLSRSTSASSSTGRSRLVKPRLFIMMETEIWPNLLRACHRARREDDARQRPDLVAARTRATGSRARSSAASCSTSIASACRATNRPAASSTSAPPRERVVGHRLAEVRLARVPRRTALPTAVPHDRSRPQPRAPLLPRSPRPAGRHRREHAARAKRSPCSKPSSGFARRCRTRCSSSRRASPSGSTMPSGSPARAGWTRRPPNRAARRCRAAQRRRHPRHHRRAGAALSDRHGGLRRRQPRRRWRPQYPGAGGLREANRLWSAHAEFRRDCADVPRQRRGDPGARRRASSSRSLIDLLGDPVRRASLGAAARALVEANRGARDKSLAVLAELLPSRASSVVRPFRRLCD